MKRGQLATAAAPNSGAVVLDDSGYFVRTLSSGEYVVVLTDVEYAPWHKRGAEYGPMYHAVLDGDAVRWVFFSHLASP